MTGHATYVSSATTTQVFIGKGRLLRINVGETAAGAITVYDATGNDTTPIVAVLKASIAEGTYEFDIEMQTGCKVVTAAASKITIVTA